MGPLRLRRKRVLPPVPPPPPPEADLMDRRLFLSPDEVRVIRKLFPDQAQRSPGQRRCKLCHQIGHYARTCGRAPSD